MPQTRGQSSPGNLQSGQQPSNGIRQIPQLSSLAIHRHVATPVQPKGKVIFKQRFGMNSDSGGYVMHKCE